MKLHSSIEAMAKIMQQKLDANAHKGGWMPPHCTTTFLRSKLKEEVQELNDALDRWEKASIPIEMLHAQLDVRLEAADVANIAMMLADNIGALIGTHEVR